MMTRRHNLKRARLDLPLYPTAAPFIPLRQPRRKDPRQLQFAFVGERAFRTDGLFSELMREEMDKAFPGWRKAWDNARK